ncbi:MAG: bifunctional ADP-dependent NAD(P)H-hydrate dehydratase/NAD(P)H-hydrate epimerase [Micrococcaceae bacterium]|nr:bifunctional ADP-dependent NAD(P)H-hydrate dehydratase/NAD(P)H-hydrate epimerase [Micrococcaceae bacterium]
MYRAYTGTQVRAAEQVWLDAGCGTSLIRRAAWGLAHHTLALLGTRGRVYGTRVLGLVGKGNNGGDTLWALSFLASRGVSVAAVAINTDAEHLHAEGFEAFKRAGGRLINRINPDTAVVLDGVFGTGFHGSFDLPGYLADHGLHIPAQAGVVACDIPSGVNADTGEIAGRALRADLTVTFGANKVGLLAGAGGQHSGDIRVVDIGIQATLNTVEHPWCVPVEADILRVYKAPDWDVHKYSRGALSVCSGSAQYPGAAVLVVNAAEATGVGYVSLVADPLNDTSVSDKVLTANPQAVVENQVTDKATALVIGPGLGDTAGDKDSASSALETALRRNIPLLIDASGLDMLDESTLAQDLAATVLTPHVGELSRLIDRLAPDLTESTPVEQAHSFAQRFGVWMVLKSADTYVFSPAGRRAVHPAKTSELATAGTGDTLAGILGAGMSTLDPNHQDFSDQLFAVLAAGVRLHSRAGELAAADGGVVVSTLADYIRTAKQR